MARSARNNYSSQDFYQHQNLQSRNIGVSQTSLNRKTKEQIDKIIRPSEDSQFSYKPKFFKIKSPDKEDDNKSYKSEETKLHLIKKY
jgi:hypothetical protein